MVGPRLSDVDPIHLVIESEKEAVVFVEEVSEIAVDLNLVATFDMTLVGDELVYLNEVLKLKVKRSRLNNVVV